MYNVKNCSIKIPILVNIVELPLISHARPLHRPGLLLHSIIWLVYLHKLEITIAIRKLQFPTIGDLLYSVKLPYKGYGNTAPGRAGTDNEPQWRTILIMHLEDT